MMKPEKGHLVIHSSFVHKHEEDITRCNFDAIVNKGVMFEVAAVHVCGPHKLLAAVRRQRARAVRDVTGQPMFMFPKTNAGEWMENAIEDAFAR